MKSIFLLITMLITHSMLAQDLKTISFNIRYANTADGNNQWDLRKAAVNDFVAYEQPDFMGLQEALLSQIEDVLSSSVDYGWIGVGRDDGKQQGEYSPLFYNKKKWKLIESNTFWLSQTPEMPSKDWDAALPRICTWGKFESMESAGIIYVFNTHYDHIGEEARQQSSELILRKIKEISDFRFTILMGDFNAELNTTTIQSIVQSPLSDAFESAKVKFGQQGTFNGFNSQEIPAKRIDYVFHSSDLVPIKYTVDSRLIDGRFLSDHFPVIVSF